MVLEEALYSHLSADAGVSALVATRIYPLVIPQDAQLPAIAFQRISGARLRSHAGPTGLAHPRIQFTVTAPSYGQAKAVAGALRVALDGFKGVMGGGVTIEECSIDNEIDGYNQETGSQTVRLDFIIWHKE